MVDIIMKKKDGGTLTPEEIAFFVSGVVDSSIPDYQTTALLMAIYYKGMTDAETAVLTRCMADSGDHVDLSDIAGVKVDKHSTGGVGDKTSLVVAPVAAACGVKVAKMSGRGLGHTGGTVDKLEAIPGFQTQLPREKFVEIVNEVGVAMVGQSADLAPADKKLYALRDVTATVDSLPLIASSIMSKKLAAGDDCILLDVKTGSGAFMRTLEGSVALAKAMVAIGESAGKRTAALITDMDIPLGHAVGNALEVKEAVETLRGRGPRDLTDLCLRLAAGMLELAGLGGGQACMAMAREALESGRAFEILRRMTAAQGGDVSVLDDPARFPQAPVAYEVRAERAGFIAAMDTTAVGTASALLGAGRATAADAVDPAAGILLAAKTGDAVEAGGLLATFFTSSREKLAAAEAVFRAAVSVGDKRPAPQPLVYARVDKTGCTGCAGGSSRGV